MPGAPRSGRAILGNVATPFPSSYLPDDARVAEALAGSGKSSNAESATPDEGLADAVGDVGDEVEAKFNEDGEQGPDSERDEPDRSQPRR